MLNTLFCALKKTLVIMCNNWLLKHIEAAILANLVPQTQQLQQSHLRMRTFIDVVADDRIR